jgi:putative tryptophan/tyrosine transport system substrate-binding protein
MNRREVITLLGGAVAWPLPAGAEQAGRRRLVGVVAGFSEADTRVPMMAFRSKLTELGWVEGRTLAIDTLAGAGDYERMTADAKFLVDRNPDVIVVVGTPALTAVRQHTSNIPVVFAVVADPVRAGIIESLARPGGQSTGFTNFEFSIGGKWLELLREVSPRLTHVMVLANPTNTATNSMARFIEDVGRSASFEIITMSVRNVADVQTAISNGARQPNCGLIVLPDGMTLVHSELIVSLANRHGLPSIYPYRVFAEKGGLLTYGLDVAEMYRRTAGYVDRILKGEKPGNLAVQAPNKFELLINLKAAKALGLDIPPTLLARADEVIE